MANARQEAIKTIATAKHKLNNIDFRTKHAKDLFGENVFNEEQQSLMSHGTVAQAIPRAIHCSGDATWCIPYGLVDDIHQRGAVPYLRIVPRADPFA